MDKPNGNPAIRVFAAEGNSSQAVCRRIEENQKSDDEFQTASECTLRNSCSPTYESASECEARYSPWWDYDKQLDPNVSKEKMVLAVGCPNLPAAHDVLTPSPELPPGKIVHEVIETTHLRVEHSHKLGVQSFVLSSETVRENKGESYSSELIPQSEDVQNREGLLKEIEECGKWLQLKILEITPELTKLGNTLAEALELQRAHDEVLRQLQNKQSPVEELLRQADQLIVTQKPRAEVYAAMAETLGRAWRDINSNLEIRKHILDLNVNYHRNAGDFFDKIQTLEEMCTDTVIPIEIPAVKEFLTNIHELRRTLLESLMGALQAGNSLLEKIKELGAEGTLDSRPEQIRHSVNKALSQVQSWLDELHIRRQDVESTFNRRKLQLEQCLALAILAADLRELEGTVINCRNRLAGADQLGDSASSTELLQHENRKLLPEAQLLQEKALKITKATEQLLESGCFAGEEATKQAYAILSLTSDYLTELQNRNALLERVLAFFKSAQSVLNKLDHLEIQLTTSNLRSTSPELVELHRRCSSTIQEITADPIAEGYAILNAVGEGSTGSEGVKRTIEDLENIKIRLDALCIAHREENLRINRALENFFDSYTSIQAWLTGIAEAFLQSHKDMGNNLLSANDFMDLHNKLLIDLQDKGNEINGLLLTLPPIVEYLDDDKRGEVDRKVEELHERWMNLKSILENRLDLGRIYVKFHTEADIVNNEMDKLEQNIAQAGQNIDDKTLRSIERKWESLEPLYQSAKNTALTFINDAEKVSEPYLDTKRACICVDNILRKLTDRQLLVTRTWQTFNTDIIERKELLVKLEETMVESTKTINWVTKLNAQLYPVITINSYRPREIASFVQNKLSSVLPDIKRAQNEVDQKIKTAETLIAKTNTDDEKVLNVRNKLSELNQKLMEISTDYQVLLQQFVNYFNTLADIEKRGEEFNDANEEIVKDSNRLRNQLAQHEASGKILVDMFDFALKNCEDIVNRITNQEPPEAARHDIDKLRYTLELTRKNWDEQHSKKRNELEQLLTFWQFDEDLNNINRGISNLEKQNEELKNRYGKSLEEAKASSLAYASFERTIEELDKKIAEFIDNARKLISQQHSHTPVIEKHIKDLQQRWNTLKNHIQQTRYLIDLSIQYFQLVNEADDWFKEGNRLLVSIARRTSLVKKPEEAEELLKEIAIFLRPGEEKQNERIAKIMQLVAEIYGPERAKYMTRVVDENREMMKSFASVKEELDNLGRNLLQAEEEKKRLEKAKREAEEAEKARLQAEIKRKAVEDAEKARLQAEIERRAAEEAEKARRLAEAERRAAEEAEKARRVAEMERKAAEEAEKARILAEIERRAAEEALEKQKQLEIERKAAEEAQRKSRLAPVFVTPLADAVIPEGSKLSFICQVTGTPLPVVTWFKDGIPIENNPDYQTTFEKGLCTLVIEETFADDSARYTCKATNEVGSAETSAFLCVKETEPKEQLTPPTFTKLLEPASIKEGSTFQFHCTVEGNPLPDVQWFKNQDCIDFEPGYNITYNNGDAFLRFDKVAVKDKGEYTCKVSNKLGSAQSTASLSVTLLLPAQPPEIIMPLSNVMARTGQKIKLECEVTGMPIPEITWYQNGHPLKETREMKLHREGDKATLVIYEAFLKDAGTYKVAARNVSGEASSSCSVSVKGRLPNETSDSEIASDMEPVKPSIQLPLSDLVIGEGSRVRLDCVIVGQPEPEVIWYHDGRPVKESTDFQLLFQGDRCSLVIQEALPEDGGDYKVVALNSAGEASSKCKLTVQPKSLIATEKTIPVGFPPKFNKLLADVLVSEGDKVIFEGNVTGQPKPEIRWLLNNLPVKLDDHTKVIVDEEGNIKLEIERVTPEDKGVYTVKAINEHGEAKCFAQLIVKSSKIAETIKYEEVKSAPLFTEIFNDRIAFENTASKFECIVTGKPKPKIKWLFRGEPITGNNNILISTSGDRQVLSIPNVSQDTQGTITCVAENEVGTASCSATLTVHSLTTITLPEETKTDSSIAIKREIHTESSTVMSSKVISSSLGKIEPETKIHSFKSHDERTYKQVNQQTPEISESHNVEEYLQLGNREPIIHEKSSSTFSTQKPQVETVVQSIIQKPIQVKTRPPKFVTPVVGKIVDQSAHVILEGIVDGQPSPVITWSKNGKDIEVSDGVIIKWENNKTSLEIKEATSNDAGRYTCTATNDSGTAISTADLIVRKTIFPPVFGKRLQAQVIKKGDRIVMEVEVTGTPEPTVTWFKDSVPIEQALTENHKMKTFGNCHSLTIEKADLKHSGRFMVRAVNSGGEAQSIADIAVFEPTPDTMVEVVKTVVFEDVRKHETLMSAADKITSNLTPELKPPPLLEPSKPITSTSFTETRQQTSDNLSSSQSRSEMTSFTEQQVSQCVRTARLEYNPPEIIHGTPTLLHKQTDFELVGAPPQQDLIDAKKDLIEEGIQTSSISKESSLQYFVKKIEDTKEKEEPKKIEGYKKFETKPPVERKIDVKLPQPPLIKTTAPAEKEIKQIPINLEFDLIPEPPATICYNEPSQPTIDKGESFTTSEKKHVVEEKSFSQQTFETSSFQSSYEKQSRPLSPRPEALEMEKLWTPKREVDKIESQVIEKTTDFRTYSSMSGKEIPTLTETPRIHYVANVSHCIQPCEKKLDSLFSEKYEETRQSEHIFHEENLKPSQLLKTWKPVQPVQSYPSIDTLNLRPISVQDITNEVILEPGPPPIIDYAQPPRVRRQSYVETVEQELETKLESVPSKVPPGGVRTIPPPPPPKIVPPPLPPKKEQPAAPPIPAKSIRLDAPKKIIVVEPPPPERFPDLEPFPFKAEPNKPKHLKVGPPPTPSKFIKGKFTDSDYESDFELSKITPKWKPCASDNEEPTYRKVRPPKLTDVQRSKSVDPEPLPPSKFEKPIEHSTITRPEIKIKQQPKRVSPPPMKPGSPPTYVEIQPKKLDSPKIKRKIFSDGYMADTDEPFFQQKSNKVETKEIGENFSRYEYKSENYTESSQKFVSGTPIQKTIPFEKYHTPVSSFKKELTATPIITSVSTEARNEKFEQRTKIEQQKQTFASHQSTTRSIKCPPPPSPSKFVKGEFRESDYESDYDKPIPKIWKPGGANDTPNYRPIKPLLTSTTQDEWKRTVSPLRPKFEPIDKLETNKMENKTVVFKPKPITGAQTAVNYIALRPGTPPEIAYAAAPKTTQIYRSTTSMPYHNAVQTETSNIVHFKESSEKCHRTVSLEQSTKVIKFGEKQQDVKIAKITAPPPTTPKKFIACEFRESDYESDVDHTKIKPKWAPSGSDTEDLHFRPVRPPSTTPLRASSTPPTKERVVTPMEFDKYPPYIPSDSTDGATKKEASWYGSIDRKFKKTGKPDGQPEYGVIVDPKFKSKATTIASHHMDNMTQAFKSKTQKFVSDIIKDVEHQQPIKSILKNGDDKDLQVYREESRAAQHGTKHIDPDTGLIYFKYDFGYEFGIVLPGESKNGGVPVPPKTIFQPPKRTGDIELPVYHETTKKQDSKPKSHKTSNQTVKWEPTSESELSEYEGTSKRISQGSRWEPSSCSPVSLSPSLPSYSPAFNSSFAATDKYRAVDTPPNCPSTPVNAQKGSSGQIRAPMFITPLRNIAVVSGQNAKFECIVQSEPAPSVLWSKNGRIIEDSDDYQIHYRNGVCRLTISRAYPEDAGTYTCTASNLAGNASTTAILDVPGEIKSAYIK